ncbi:MAG: VWA domain-containing protein, partial [Acidobacteriota bacterium]|nr:VWA domain-containing protein [Acidobacteriota bacterium]
LIPVEGYAETSRQDVLRAIGAMTSVVNVLSGIPGRKALLQVSDGLALTPGEELFQIYAHLCGQQSDAGGPNELANSLLSSDTSGSQGGDEPSYDPNRAQLDAQRYGTGLAFQKLTARASSNRVTIYTLQASGLSGSAAADASVGARERLLTLPNLSSGIAANLRGPLTMMASDTGGRAILDANDLGPDLDRLRDDFATYYSLAYSASHHGDGREHRIELRLKRPGLQAAYRRSYRDKPSLERAADRTVAALFTGASGGEREGSRATAAPRTADNPLEIGVEVGEPLPDPAGAVRQVPVKLSIPLWKLTTANRNETYEGRLRLLIATRGANGVVSPVRQVRVPIHIKREQLLTAMGQYFQYDVTLTLAKGENRVAIAVRDELAMTTSYLSRTIQVGGGAPAAPGQGR